MIRNWSENGTDTCGNFVQNISGYYQYETGLVDGSFGGVYRDECNVFEASSWWTRNRYPPYCPVVLSCGDVRDNIIAFGIGFIPVCSDFTQTAHSVYFTFAEINVTGDYTWALIRQPLIIHVCQNKAAEKEHNARNKWRG
jgi:hypothetical protein